MRLERKMMREWKNYYINIIFYCLVCKILRRRFLKNKFCMNYV